jgi:MFS family permease
MFSALRHRNFRLYVSGQSVSLIGTWMQQLATSWIVYRLTSSPLWLGISMFSTQLPTSLFGWMAGVLVDRVNKQKLLLWTQVLAGVQALLLAILTLTGRINLAEIIAMNLVLGCVNAVDMPLRQSFVIQLIGSREDLPNAIALNSSVMNGTRLIGPALAGATIAAAGEGICFLLNALSYVAVVAAITMMSFPESESGADRPDDTAEDWIKSLRAGVRTAFAPGPIRPMLIFLAFVSLTGMNYNTLFPALAIRVNATGGAAALGAVTSASGLGALAGALYMARRKGTHGLADLSGRAACVFGLALGAVAWVRSYPVLLVAVFAAGLSLLLILAGGNTLIQTSVEDSKRGRVMSIFSFSLLGVAPFGSLLMGWLAEHLGLTAALALNGALCIVGGAYYLRHHPRTQADEAHLTCSRSPAAGT